MALYFFVDFYTPTTTYTTFIYCVFQAFKSFNVMYHKAKEPSKLSLVGHLNDT